MSGRIGVLAVQGAFIEHIHALEALGAECFEIRQRSDIEGQDIDGLILPGGESTVMGKLLNELGIFEPMERLIKGGLPVFGTCAGLILLADKISNDNNRYFGTMEITVKRNAYGRQLGSFKTDEDFRGIGKIPMTFIRAPLIESVTDKVDILSEANGQIVAAKQGKMLVTSFHPELTADYRVHRYFLDMIKG